MGINFHNEKNRNSYTTRNADNSWVNTIKDLVPIENISNATDIGCGGGIYSKALADMGVSSITGVDFSEAILEGAKENCKEYKNISFKQGNAFHTGLKSNEYDLLLERALIHHIDDLQKCFQEAYRLLKDEGYFIVQDRTPDDCLLKDSDSHIRGYFFELFPKLIEKETNRRHNSRFVMETLKEVGFREIQEVKLWEKRKVYDDKEQLLEDLRARTGRSILHELDDEELKLLINYIDKSISIEYNIVEKDRWTIWIAVK
ncbi:class I SAM-dependent methyltransferase [Sporosarcina sp. Marseille-Q4063]|uniref:class I SAM-dependent methyltransferase n=1 Tax=Sporosarcina sp. Marseille-Q4063 TaxID=2810514 RepID=UPI001BAEC7DB|nr:class I SAM-dependent methyltransferase [Sporosarcina sp. Marseille-Q4063]QUW23577.1 class I SAM-dependent methyltransferase [Sporosarcina sp. Marseille-Q4063]